jgi:hypothetical protein
LLPGEIIIGYIFGLVPTVFPPGRIEDGDPVHYPEGRPLFAAFSPLAGTALAEADLTLVRNQTMDTPRKRAVRLGEALDAQAVMVGTVWKYRERGALVDMPEGSASVGYALYLVDAKTGIRFWRGTFDGTQKALTQDVLGGLKHLEIRLRWLSAEELARYGVKPLL